MILLFVAIILILALFAVKLSNKSGIPSLLLFLLLGIICSFLGVDFENYHISEGFASTALIVIMFYGGFGTNWKMGKPVVKEAAVLASLGVVATALLTGVFTHLVFHFPIMESLLLGSIVGSTDYASVSNILKSKNLNLKYNTASLLELESGSNDPTAYTMTMLFMSILLGSDLSIPLMVLKQVVFGLLLGYGIAQIIERLLWKLNLQQDGLSTVFMASMALLTYSLTDVIGGNGYLAVYIMGIIIGNKAFLGKRDVIFFFDGLTELMSIGLFFLLGLLADPNKILSSLPVAFVIMIFMSFIGRPLSVFGLMLPFKLKRNQLITISWAGLRGAAAIAFAIMVVNRKLELSIDVYHIVFGICFLSSFLQGSLMAPLSHNMDMLDPHDTVLTTYNFYADKSAIGFLKTVVREGSSIAGTKVKDINLNFDLIIAKIERRGETIIPRGEVVIEEGDVIVFGGEEYFDPHNYGLLEFSVSGNHPWVDKRIVDLDLSDNCLILTVKRGEEFVIAGGDTFIEKDDRIVLLAEDQLNFNPHRID